MTTQNRDSIGQYRSPTLSKWKRFVIKLFFALIIFSALIGAIRLYIVSHPVIRTVTNTITVDTSTTTYAAKIDSLEKSLVESIRKCESAGHKESDGLVTFDPTDAQFANRTKSTIVNKGEMSFGTLQFKVSTVQFYYKSLYKQSITGKEAILIALDDTLSGSLAQDILFKSSNLANDWSNCANRLSINDQIVAIKKIK